MLLCQRETPGSGLWPLRHHGLVLPRLPDAALLALVARHDGDALAELFRRYATVVVVAAGWNESNAATAERRTVDVFLDLWNRPGVYGAAVASTRSYLIRAAMHGATEEAIGIAAAQLAALEGWTYHDVAHVLARPAHQVALVIREQLCALQE